MKYRHYLIGLLLPLLLLPVSCEEEGEEGPNGTATATSSPTATLTPCVILEGEVEGYLPQVERVNCQPTSLL
ncbi:unnamed protein product, partial [marine sediment metagenome]